MMHRAASFQSFVSSTAPTDPSTQPTAPMSRSQSQGSGRGADQGVTLRHVHASEPTGLHKRFLDDGSLLPNPLLESNKVAEAAKRARVLRWDGTTRDTSKWDCLRRDPELFEDTAECAIHFAAHGKSQRGPSLMIPMEAIARAGCASLFTTNHFKSDATSDSGYSSTASEESDVYDLYFPAPEHLSGADSLTYHLTTRNLFAWIMDRPLVGISLGRAMIDLLERMLLVRPATEDSLDDCVAYAERMGYLYMTNHPDYALAMLAFSEHAEHEQIRNNAFVHCVGMNDMLSLSPDYSQIGKNTQQALTKEALRMDVKVDRVMTALPGLMEEDNARAKLGLTPSQRAHLERFRSFVQSFYVSKFGYWPPPVFTKAMLSEMRFEFGCLFELLVHRAQSSDQSATTLGGLSVRPLLDAFDQRHDFTPLDSYLPRLPTCANLDGRALNAKGLRGLLQSKSARRDWLARAQADLLSAVNKDSDEVMECALVKRYLEFERDSVVHLELDLAIADARKVRWIQIYYILQMLKSAVDTSPDVTFSEIPTYHTCCNIPPMVKPPKAQPSALLIHPALRTSLTVTTTSTTSAPTTPSDLQSSDSSPPLTSDTDSNDYFLTKPKKSSPLPPPIPLKCRRQVLAPHLRQSSSGSASYHSRNSSADSTFLFSNTAPLPSLPSRRAGAFLLGPPMPSPWEFDVAAQFSDNYSEAEEEEYLNFPTPPQRLGPYEYNTPAQDIGCDNPLAFAALLRRSSSAYRIPSSPPGLSVGSSETVFSASSPPPVPRRHVAHHRPLSASTTTTTSSTEEEGEIYSDVDEEGESFSSAPSSPISTSFPSVTEKVQGKRRVQARPDSATASWLADLADGINEEVVWCLPSRLEEEEGEDEEEDVVEWVDVPRSRICA